jgi:ribosomal protein S27E
MTSDSAKANAKFACPSCGGEAHWNASKKALICAYCGTEAPGDLDEKTGEIREIDLVSALRSLGDDSRGWKSDRVSVKCQSCDAISVFDPETSAKKCEFCGSAQILPHEQRQAPISPESLLPFVVTEGSVREDMRKWYGSRWFAPNRLKKGAMTDTTKGVYIPYWTFDAQSHADWRAQSGYYYYVSESYRDSEGKSRSRQVRKIRWQNSSGALDHFFDDLLVPGTKGVEPELLGKVEPFPTDQLVAYDPGFVSGWLVEQYQIDLIAAAQHSQNRMDENLKKMCAGQVPGDTHRFLRVDSSFRDQTFKHILVPIWLLSYRYGKNSYQVIVNGVSGEIAGHYPKSFWKIFFLVISVLLVVGAIVLISQS